MLSYKLYRTEQSRKQILIVSLVYGTDQKRRQDSERVRTITMGPKTFTLSSGSLPERYGAK